MLSLVTRTQVTLSHRAEAIRRINVAAARQLAIVGDRVTRQVDQELRRLRPDEDPPPVIYRVLPGPMLSVRINEDGPSTMLRKQSNLSSMLNRGRKPLFASGLAQDATSQTSLHQAVLDRVLEHERKSGALIATFRDAL